MLKAEELKILEQIEKLIDSAGADSYIRMTFAGIVEVCKHNIEDDFGDSPVEDCANMRVALDAERRMHDETKRMLAEAQKMCKEALDENERLRKLSAEWEKNAHDAGDLYCELEEECKQKDAEIIRLRAEIVRMRLSMMTDKGYAELYECVKGVE